MSTRWLGAMFECDARTQGASLVSSYGFVGALVIWPRISPPGFLAVWTFT